MAIERGLGVAYGRLERYPQSVAHLQRAVDGLVATDAAPATVGATRYVLGQSRWEMGAGAGAGAGAGSEAARAFAEIEQAREELRTDPQAHTDQLAEVEDWLRRHAHEDVPAK